MFVMQTIEMWVEFNGSDLFDGTSADSSWNSYVSKIKKKKQIYSMNIPIGLSASIFWGN